MKGEDEVSDLLVGSVTDSLQVQVPYSIKILEDNQATVSFPCFLTDNGGRFLKELCPEQFKSTKYSI